MNNGNGSGVRVNNDPANEYADSTPTYSKAVERYALFFDSPEAQLRFLNNTLAKQDRRRDRLRQLSRRFQFLEQTGLYGWFLEARCYSAILEEMRVMRSYLPKDRRSQAHWIHASFSARLAFLIHQTRHAFYGASMVFALLMFLVIYSFVIWSAHFVNNSLKTRYGQSGDIAAAATTTPNPNNDLFSSKEKPFFVKIEDGYEKWSNGCAISTKYETDNHPRAYYTIPRGSETAGEQKSNKIVGIVYHTPESYMVDFIPDNNQAIQQSSKGLLEYVQRHKSYNYMINRIGEIYRIVRDDQTANHAGESLWADGQNTYVFLNESFLGVCFESKFEGASSLDEILTPSQIRSGRVLTDVLRTKYNIDDANCTTHGLVAVDPDKMLIARHHDWVRFFPFEPMGLSDKYKIQPPTMTDYGFTYDEDVMAKLGNNLWAGAKTAGAEFNRRAERLNVSADDLRRKMRDRYASQRNKVYGLHPEHGDANNARLSRKPSGDDDPAAEPSDSQPTSDAWKDIN